LLKFIELEIGGAGILTQGVYPEFMLIYVTGVDLPMSFFVVGFFVFINMIGL